MKYLHGVGNNEIPPPGAANDLKMENFNHFLAVATTVAAVRRLAQYALLMLPCV